ncbi:CBU_0592 family membrane protein [Sinomonas atrocyanea]|uniref:CBU_0592 family membrane protein n=1 Tax=Sinomonas atrocyanea TaxID=37927 RepID=UPI003D98C534
MALAIDLIGWAAALSMLGAYASLSLGWISSGAAFQGVNLAGSAAFMVNSWYHGAMPSVALNIAWSGISAIALLRALRVRRAASLFIPAGNPHDDDIPGLVQKGTPCSGLS